MIFTGVALIAAVAIFLVAATLYGFDSRTQQRRRLLANAHREHQLWMNGDDRGTYGEYPPAI